MFLLLMQFLMRYLTKLVGKDLPFHVILELIADNLAYMVVLAVPMSVLLATIAVFARLSETGAYVVIRSAGISLPRLMWPAVVAGMLVMTAMLYFNNYTLPDANYRALGLWRSITKQKPAFSLRSGAFVDLPGDFAIRAMHVSQKTGELRDVTVYDYSNGARIRTSINAAGGVLRLSEDETHLELTLQDGAFHKFTTPLRGGRENERYEWMRFKRHFLTLDMTELMFERSNPESISRAERTMRIDGMFAMVDTLKNRRDRNLAEFRSKLDPFYRDRTERQDPPVPDAGKMQFTSSLHAIDDSLVADPHVHWSELDTLTQNVVFEIAMRDARSRQADFENLTTSIRWYERKVDSYMVEIHKKFSIAFACLVFVLLGAPLVLLFKRGSLGFITALSGGIFVFYWVTLVLGEKYSDQGDLAPWIGMWAANIVFGLLAIVLLISGYRGQISVPDRLRRSLASPENQ